MDSGHPLCEGVPPLPSENEGKQGNNEHKWVDTVHGMAPLGICMPLEEERKCNRCKGVIVAEAAYVCQGCSRIFHVTLSAQEPPLSIVAP